jgi:hypothetical protein
VMRVGHAGNPAILCYSPKNISTRSSQHPGPNTWLFGKITCANLPLSRCGGPPARPSLPVATCPVA